MATCNSEIVPQWIKKTTLASQHALEWNKALIYYENWWIREVKSEGLAQNNPLNFCRMLICLIMAYGIPLAHS